MLTLRRNPLTDSTVCINNPYYTGLFLDRGIPRCTADTANPAVASPIQSCDKTVCTLYESNLCANRPIWSECIILYISFKPSLYFHVRVSLICPMQSKLERLEIFFVIFSSTKVLKFYAYRKMNMAVSVAAALGERA